jgi:DNA-binding IscR family transcriptional regulator
MFDTRVCRLVQLLCYLKENGCKAPLKKAAKECSIEYATANEYINRLGKNIVASEQGRNGGTYLINPDVSIGELAKCFDLTKHVRDTLGNARLATALNRLNRLTISDLSEEDA